MENLNVAITQDGLGWASTEKWKEVLEARPYVASVTLEKMSTVTQEELNAYDLIVNTYENWTSSSQSKLRGLTVPILNLNHYAYGVLSIAANTGTKSAQTDLKIIDNTHEITEAYSQNELVTVQESQRIGYLLSVAPDIQLLGEIAGFSYAKALCALEVGGEFLDSFVNTSRFVQFGLYYIDAVHDITADGLTMLDSIITWLRGSLTYTLSVWKG